MSDVENLSDFLFSNYEIYSNVPKFEQGKSYCLVAHNVGLGKYFIDKYMKTDVMNIENTLVLAPEDNISIDEIRQIKDFLEFRSQNDKKIVLIYEADKMTQEAANAFLKTLEEPPIYSIIILVTSRYNSLLPTIRSRVHKIVLPFPKLPEQLDDFEKYVLLWNFDFLDRILNKDYSVLDIEKLADKDFDKLDAVFTVKFLIEKYLEAPLKEYMDFVRKISGINKFSFLKLFAKVVAWFYYRHEKLKIDEKIYYLKICDEIERSRIGNFNYQLTYYILLLGLRGENI
ncbi:MAG: AAA family ATPase [Fervidobacterium sp.]